MKLRQIVGIFLFHHQEVLMIKRSSKQQIAPGYWSNVGGHMEPEEINDPRAACLRELQEETGYQPHEIQDLTLRYIVMGKFNNELHTYYDYTARTQVKKELPPCHEGQLQWVKTDELNRYAMPTPLQLLLEHYQDHGNQNGVYVGVLDQDKSQPKIHWQHLT